MKKASKTALNTIPASSRPKKAQMKATEITYFSFSPAGAASGNSCIVGLGKNGVVYVPAAVFPDEGRVALAKAVAQQVEGGVHEGHAFLPAEWVKNELAGLPERIQIVDNMAAAVRAKSHSVGHRIASDLTGSNRPSAG